MRLPFTIAKPKIKFQGDSYSKTKNACHKAAGQEWEGRFFNYLKHESIIIAGGETTWPLSETMKLWAIVLSWLTQT